MGMIFLGGAAPVTSKDPGEISGLQAWYRADLGVTKDGSDLVSQWDDQGPGGYDLTSSGSSRPLWKASQVNGQDAIEFDGSDDEMVNAAAGFDIAQPFHVFLILKNVSWTSGGIIIEFGTAGGVSYLQQDTAGGDVRQYAGNNVNIVNIGTTNFALVQSFFNGASSYQAKNNDSAVTADAGTQTLTNGITLARWHSDILEGNVSFAELAFFDAKIIGGDLAGLKTYFNTRYNLWGG